MLRRIRRSTFFLSLFFLVGCVMPVPVLPPPTPTTVTGTLLPFEMILSGTHCDQLDSDYQLFLATSQTTWNDIWSELQENNILSEAESAIMQVATRNDFQTQGLLLALRKCQSSPIPSIRIDRVVEVSNDHLTVYIELRQHVPGSGHPAEADGYYEIGRIPWPEDNSDSPTIEVVGYELWSENGTPMPN